MSLDTRKCSEGFGSPPGCETFKFALTESQLSMDTCPVMEIVQNHSSVFQHVVIRYINCKKTHLIKSWCKYFKIFLRILTSNSRLISVEFLNLSKCFEHIDTATYAHIYRAILDFLGSQHLLEEVEFRSCSFRLHDGVELLRKLTENSRESLTALVLREFIRYEPTDQVISSFQDSLVINPSTATQSPPSIFDLPNLTNLEIDYSLIFENMVARQSTSIQTVKFCLSEIILDYRTGIIPIEYFRGLTSSDWRFLKTLCPDLQVELNIYTDSLSRREVEFLIAPNMPITRLEYLCEASDMESGASDMQMESDSLFGHLLACKTNDHLVSLVFDCDLNIPVSASTFPPFLQACRKLQELEVSVTYPANGVDRLLQSWLENRPESLEKVRIDIREIEEKDEYANLMSLASELRLRGLNVTVNLYC
ncbi:hypothetical protein AVEN_131192-1 [Araneus ventricosus]|uniref:Uncharacterized protein n=1 Tax=Araneus ventricosus TaxID=182803 RepID=A0A4Y2LAX8_ARAVE|nr:hypothetical protein AVEN_131192-1 [Araneus ventricosus]